MRLARDDDWMWYTHGVEFYAAMLSSGVNFAQANYGDGEWGCILGHQRTNSQGETYCPELSLALQRTLLEPVGMWCGTNPGQKLRPQVDAWVSDHRVDVPWIYKETLAAANVNGELAPVFRALRTRRVVLVGPRHLSRLPDNVVGKPAAFVEVPDGTAWQVFERTCADVGAVVQDGDVVLFASGMATNLSVHRLWPTLRGRVTLLDIGACLDPYGGVVSRKGYRKDSFQNEAKARNLEGLA